MSGAIGAEVLGHYLADKLFAAELEKRTTPLNLGLHCLLVEDFVSWVLEETWRRVNSAEPDNCAWSIEVVESQAVEWLRKWDPPK